MKLLQKLTLFSEEHNLIEKNDSILVALSGGADSVTLLQLLSKLRNKYKLSISAVYVNHQLRKKEAKKEELFCQNLCDSLNIELHIASVNINALSKKMKMGTEETAREYRYNLFESLADEYAYTKVALGHHQNDQVETILFRIFRGTGLTGLKGISPKRDIIIRPLLFASKDEILAYIKSHKLGFCEDKTNAQSIYKRNYIRNKLIPQVKQNLNQSVEKAIINLSETVRDEEAYLSSIVDKKIKKILSFSVGYKICLDKELYLQSDLWIQRRILRYCLANLSSDNKYPDKITVERLDNAIKTDQKSLSIPQKLEMVRIDNQIVLYKRKKIKLKQQFKISESCHLPKLNYFGKGQIKKNSNQSLKKNKNGMLARFDLVKLIEPLYIRSIEDGDRFCPLGMQGTKKIGNYLTDNKIHPVFRDEILVMEDKNGIFWIIGHEIDERVKINKNTHEVLEIEFKRKK